MRKNRLTVRQENKKNDGKCMISRNLHLKTLITCGLFHDFGEFLEDISKWFFGSVAYLFQVEEGVIGKGLHEIRDHHHPLIRIVGCKDKRENYN